MVKFIYVYLAIGILLNFIYDLLITHVLTGREELRFNMNERCFMCLTWPIAAVISTVRTAKIYMDNKKK